MGGLSKKAIDEQTGKIRRCFNPSKRPSGLSLIEVIIGLVIFLGLGLAVYDVIIRLARLNSFISTKVVVTAQANEEIETIRNLAYDDVGTVGGLPAGVMAPTKTVIRNGMTFSVATVIRSIDDAFDGTISGSPGPVDTAPADYKQVQVTVSCSSCAYSPIVTLITTVAPEGLELATGNGALFTRIIDALAQPLSGATVHITNPSVSPAVDMTDVTNVNGELQLVDVPVSVNGYHIEVTRSGYSSDSTLAATVANPNPTKPDATVAAGTVTSVTLAIDVLSTLGLTTTSLACAPLSGVSVHLEGSKQIGSAPIVLKYEEDTTSDGAGQINRTLEWDSYNAIITDAGYAQVGTVGTLPVNLLPNSHQDIFLILGSPTANGLHVTVKDAVTLLPLSGANVKLTKTGFEENAVTGRGYLRQTDWVGGAGQEVFTDETRYQSDDGQVDIVTSGQVTLAPNGSDYYGSGVLTSSTFDTGGPTNFTNISWAPVSQPPPTGANSVKFQIATNNDNATWDFIGPDGTASTYYTASNETINPIHNNTRYLRYRLFLSAVDVAFTPLVSDTAISFTSGCVPPGQALFTGLGSFNYDVAVQATGYFDDLSSVSVSGWTDKEILLTPS